MKSPRGLLRVARASVFSRSLPRIVRFLPQRGPRGDAVTRNEDGKRILLECSTDGPNRARMPDAPCKFAVGDGFSKRNADERAPDQALKRGARKRKREQERASPTGKVLLQLTQSFCLRAGRETGLTHASECPMQGAMGRHEKGIVLQRTCLSRIKVASPPSPLRSRRTPATERGDPLVA